MTAPDVVVSIVNHSNRDDVLECIDALLRSPRSHHGVEIVVLDNASRDGSVDAIRERFPRITVIAENRRRGFGANHNRVVALTHSRYVLFLNDDAVIDSRSLDLLLEYLETRPRVGAVGPRIESPNGRRQQTAWRSPTPVGCLVFALTLGRVGWVQSTGDEPRPVGWASACALLVRRDAFEQVGGFDERFFMYAEDADLCRRLTRAGYDIHFHPGARVVHLGQRSSTAEPARRANEQWRSLGVYWAKHHGRAGIVARVLLGSGLVAKALASTVIATVNPRPPEERRWTPGEFWGDAGRALTGVRGPGLRELADEWNRDGGTP